MSVKLGKGEKVELGKFSRLTSITVGLGWQERKTSGFDFDLDASVFALEGGDRVPSDDWFIFYNNLQSPDGSIVHQGDNLTGDDGSTGEDSDDEEIIIDLTRLPSRIQTLVIPVTIFEAERRRQNFGQVRDSYVRIVDNTTGMELARYDLTDGAHSEDAMVFAHINRTRIGWEVEAVGHGVSGGLYALCKKFGVNV